MKLSKNEKDDNIVKDIKKAAQCLNVVDKEVIFSNGILPDNVEGHLMVAAGELLLQYRKTDRQ